MASAYMALEDNISASSYNPGNYSFYSTDTRFRITPIFSPLSPLIAANQSSRIFGKTTLNREKNASILLSSLKAVNISYMNMNLGVVLAEPYFHQVNYYSETQRAFHADSIIANHYNTVTFNLRLAQQVAIGASFYWAYFYDEEHEIDWKYGTSYGIMMQPKNYFRIGVSLTNFANEISSIRSTFDEITTDAVNIGVALFFPWHMSVDFDLRNIAVGGDNVREKYLFGIEQMITSQIALRSGVKFKNSADQPLLTAGIGLIDLNSFWLKNRAVNHPDHLLNYALIVDEIGGEQFYIHAFNFNIRI